MYDFEPTRLVERNPVTHRAHRREVFRQITLPLIAGVIVILALMVLAVLASPGAASKWGDISLIWLILPSLACGLVGFAVVGGLTYGIILLVRKLPLWMLTVQDLFETIGAMVRRIDDKLVEPILKAHGYRASMRVFRRRTDL